MTILKIVKKDTGAGRGIRTHDLHFTKVLLYQLSYSGVFGIVLAMSQAQHQ